jgi:hypothetical protein
LSDRFGGDTSQTPEQGLGRRSVSCPERITSASGGFLSLAPEDIRKHNVKEVPPDHTPSVLPASEQHEPGKVDVSHISSNATSATISSSTAILSEHQITTLKLMTASEPTSKDFGMLDTAVREGTRALLPSTLDSSHHLHIGAIDLEGISQHGTSAISSVAKALTPAKRSKPSTLERGLQPQFKEKSLSQKDAESLTEAADTDKTPSTLTKKARRPGSKDVSPSQSDPLLSGKTKKPQAANWADAFGASANHPRSTTKMKLDKPLSKKTDKKDKLLKSVHGIEEEGAALMSDLRKRVGRQSV